MRGMLGRIVKGGDRPYPVQSVGNRGPAPGSDRVAFAVARFHKNGSEGRQFCQDQLAAQTGCLFWVVANASIMAIASAPSARNQHQPALLNFRTITGQWTTMVKPVYATSAAALLLSCAAVLPVKQAQAALLGPRHFRLGYAKHGDANPRGPRRGKLTALVGDRESGLGFYSLPARFRTRIEPDRRPGEAIRYAVATEAGTASYGLYGGYGRGRFGRGVFNPVDGYGSPFFAGYYGPAGDPDDERGPFGNPYN